MGRQLALELEGPAGQGDRRNDGGTSRVEERGRINGVGGRGDLAQVSHGLFGLLVDPVGRGEAEPVRRLEEASEQRADRGGQTG